MTTTKKPNPMAAMANVARQVAAQDPLPSSPAPNYVPAENLGTAPAAANEPAAAPDSVANPPSVKAKRRVGRPPKVEKVAVQTTTIRLDPDDHHKVRSLALYEHKKMNELVFEALKEYCRKRKVFLEGVPR